MNVRFITVLIAAGYLSFQPASSLQRLGESLILEHADTLKSRTGIREAIGNVRFLKGSAVILSDKAWYNSSNGKLMLTGSVNLIEPNRSLKADRVTYFEWTDDFDAEGNVDMTENDSVRIRCKRAQYLETEQKIDLFEDVVIDNLADNAQITGQRGHWFRQDNYGIVEINPVYRLPDNEGVSPDTLVIISERIKLDRISRSAHFTGDVKLSKGDLFAVTDSLFHRPSAETTLLTGAPVVWIRSDQISGGRMELYYEGRSLKRTIVTGNAVALSPSEEDETRRNRLAGDMMTITTPDDSTSHICVEGNAQGLYHLWDEDGNYSGVNLSAADVIEIDVIGNKTTRIVMEGGTQGTLYPPDMVPPEAAQ